MEDAKIVRLADLLHCPRPLTATASLHFPSPTSHLPPPSPPPPPLRPTNRRVLSSLNRPTIIVGTLTLPSHTASFSSPCSCFRFSDGSATVCCDILQFRACAIGKEIRVTGWNFIPFKHHGGGRGDFLEIIKWCFSDSNEGSKGFNRLSHVDSLPLVPNHGGSSCHRDDDTSRARYRVYGVIESVGPVSVVPCTMAARSSDLNSGSKLNLPGFLA